MTKNIIFLIIGGLVIFVVGGGIGILLDQQHMVAQMQVVTEQSKIISTVNSTLKILNSSVFGQLAVTGIVTEISGSNITLTYNGDSVLLPIKDGAEIYSIITPPATSPSDLKKSSGPKSVKGTIDTIKVGDDVSAFVDISSDDQVEISSITIMPAPIQGVNNSNTTK